MRPTPQARAALHSADNPALLNELVTRKLDALGSVE
jgi:hypothetical protein